MTRRTEAVDVDSLHAEIVPVLERHGVITSGERLDGWVGLLRFTGVCDDSDEYRRTELLTAPGVTVGEARTLLDDGTRQLDDRDG